MALTEAPDRPDSGARFKQAAPIAAAALAIVVAVVGVIVLTAQPGPPPGHFPAEPLADTSVAGAAAIPPAPATASADATAAPQAEQLPNGLVVIQSDQTPPAALPGQGIEILVKFKDDAKVKDIVDLFWKDQSAARAKFDAFKNNRPEFANLRLARVTYSNELVLVHEGGLAPAQRIAAMRDIATKLKNIPDISYAEPNLTAQPGGQ